jgi:DNA (cytosine-5)-methyltransferase 1
MKKELVGIDVFCGCGGLTLGLQQAGIKVLKGIDIDKTVEKTYTDNNKNTIFINEDVRKVSGYKLIKDIDRSKKTILLAGCAPCQPFSNQNRNPTKKDRRKSLIISFARLITEILPEYVLIENVPGFMKKTNKYHRDLIEILVKLDYSYIEEVINAADYGVPQKRHRYILLASKEGKIALPEGSYGPGKAPYNTVRDAIIKYPRIRPGSTNSTIPNHVSRNLSPINLKRMKFIPKNGGSRKNLPSKLILECHKTYSGHSDVYGRMNWDLPAPTLTCKCTSFTNGRFGHPSQNRAISVREAAAIQTFPDTYVFYGNVTDISRHIGNSVPVDLARSIGKSLVSISEDTN